MDEVPRLLIIDLSVADTHGHIAENRLPSHPLLGGLVVYERLLLLGKEDVHGVFQLS